MMIGPVTELKLVSLSGLVAWQLATPMIDSQQQFICLGFLQSFLQIKNYTSFITK